MRRYDLGDNIVEIKHSDGSDRWLVIKKMLDASKISLQVSICFDLVIKKMLDASKISLQLSVTIYNYMYKDREINLV